MEVGTLQQQIIVWSIDEDEFLIQLVTTGKLDLNSLEKGQQLLSRYIQLNNNCICQEILAIVCEVFLQLSMNAEKLSRAGETNKADEMMDALIEFEQMISQK